MHKALAFLFAALLWALPVAAQERAWLQVEAQPTLREAQDRARSYAARFADVNGFRLRSGWYAIALGPYPEAEAAERLAQLLQGGNVPADAFVADGAGYGQRFWPVGAGAQPSPAPAPTVTPQPPAGETPEEARRSEARLTRQERELLQEALQWLGHYTAAIDGAFGPGTRGAMRAYQEAMGYDPTGVLTTGQRAELVAGYSAEFAALGLETVEDSAAGIRITMPTKMVRFARYEPPFVHYDSAGDNGVRVLLISQKGDRNTLFGLYDIMQTLQIVPLEGRRERGTDSFVLTGQDEALQSYTYAALERGMIKGFTLIWRPADARLMNRTAEIMRESFAPFGDTALDETLGDPGGDQGVDLLSGLEIRRPEISRSGFYIDGAGTVLTTAEVLAGCARITVGDDQEARVAARDDGLGLAVLRPVEGLAPLAFAGFRTGAARLQSDVAVAGFSYEGILDLPVLTFGTLVDLAGLGGEAGLNRLALEALPGDTGGPVFDASGAVMGMLLPREDGARRLPADVSFAASAPAITGFLAASGIAVAASERTGTMAPEDLTALAADMTVLVSCWN